MGCGAGHWHGLTARTGMRIVAGEDGRAAIQRSALPGRHETGRGAGGEELELRAEAGDPAAEEHPAEQMGHDGGEQPLQAGEQQGGGFVGLRAWHASGGWGVVHGGLVSIFD